MESIKYIDLFAGIGGIRKGFELACQNKGIQCQCVFTSEIKPHAISVLKQNHPDEHVFGDITKISANEIADFDVLLAGFPCQAFSAAGKRLGFEDTRGTLFFDIARILKDKQPAAFLLENVEGLVNHDKDNPQDNIGKTLRVILQTLSSLGYKVSWRILNSKDFGIPQDRKRVYIAGTKTVNPSLDGFPVITGTLSDVLEQGLPLSKDPFVKKLLKHYRIQDLVGKSIKDKRGGNNNIHSWDIELKGKVSKKQKELLNTLLKERRKKKWASEFGIDWMDGMPLTLEQINTFYPDPKLEEMLEDLAEKGYVKKEHPKKRVGKKRVPDESLPLGYNIVAGKMSFEISRILDPSGVAPTLVAMDMRHIYVGDNGGLRRISLREGLRLFGYPDNYKFKVSEDQGYDLLGNTVVVSVIEKVSERLLEAMNECAS